MVSGVVTSNARTGKVGCSVYLYLLAEYNAALKAE